MPRVIDLSVEHARCPRSFGRASCSRGEDWDGFPDERHALLPALADRRQRRDPIRRSALLLRGHAVRPSEPEPRVIELLTGSVTSTTWLEATTAIIASDPTLPPGAAFVVAASAAYCKIP